MSRAPISRRRLMAGTGAALAAVTLPVGVVEAAAAEMPSTADLAALPEVFDPAAFCADLEAAGYRISMARSVMVEDRGRASIMITPMPGRGFDKAYELMERWADRLDATPDHVEMLVRYGFERIRATS